MIRNIKRWQWIAVSLIVGLTLGYFQQLPSEDWQKKFGGTITQSQFEQSLTREQSGLRWFRDIVVYPESIEIAGKNVPVTIVSGNYFNGKLELQDGKPAAVWRPRCYIVEGAYQPLAPAADAKATSQTVLAYLKGVKDVHFTYAWWRDPNWGMTMWTVGSFVLIGLIWPTVINLIVFGSIMRPKEERGIDLSKAASQNPQAGTRVTDADLAAVAQMGGELEAKLAAGAGVSGSGPQQPADSTARPLTAAALEATAEQAHEKKDFGRDKGDFYPTEVHKPHDDSGHA
jgi:hypothetical protein